MHTPFTTATAAYVSTSRLVGPAGAVAASNRGIARQDIDFAGLVSASTPGEGAPAAGAEQMALDLVRGNANLVDLATVARVGIAEDDPGLTRDRALSAYQGLVRITI